MDAAERLQILIKEFNHEELNTPYFECGIDYKKLTPLSKSDSASNILKLVPESGGFSQLLEIIKQQLGKLLDYLNCEYPSVTWKREL